MTKKWKSLWASVLAVVMLCGLMVPGLALATPGTATNGVINVYLRSQTGQTLMPIVEVLAVNGGVETPVSGITQVPTVAGMTVGNIPVPTTGGTSTTYVVKVTAYDGGYVITGKSAVITLTNGSYSKDVFFTVVGNVAYDSAGGYPTYPGQPTYPGYPGGANVGKTPVSGYVWMDTNYDGIRDDSEQGIAGATVTLTLTNASGVPVADSTPLTTTSFSDGAYYFVSLPTSPTVTTGQYYMVTVLPAMSGTGMSPTTPYATTDVMRASNIQQNGQSHVFQLYSYIPGVPYQQYGYQVINAGYAVYQGNVNGRVWFVDTKPAGTITSTASYTGLNGATVELINSAGTVVATTKTATIMGTVGTYLFANVQYGTYTVRVTPPDDATYQYSFLDIGTGTTGYYPYPGTGTTYQTVRVGTNGVSNSFYAMPQSAIFGADAGLLREKKPSGTISGRIWDDFDGNGSIGSDEKGINDVKVELLDASGKVLQTVKSQTSGGVTGRYVFSNVPAGNYTVRVTKPDADYTFITKGTSRVDATGKTSTITLVNNGSAVVNAGLTKAKFVVIGKVFVDANGNGIMDANEQAFTTATITLVNVGDASLNQTAVSTNGAYSFTNVPAGAYMIQVKLPSGNTFTVKGTAASASHVDAQGKSDPFVFSGGTTIKTINVGVAPSAPVVPTAKTITRIAYFTKTAKVTLATGGTATYPAGTVVFVTMDHPALSSIILNDAAGTVDKSVLKTVSLPVLAQAKGAIVARATASDSAKQVVTFPEDTILEIVGWTNKSWCKVRYSYYEGFVKYEDLLPVSGNSGEAVIALPSGTASTPMMSTLIPSTSKVVLSLRGGTQIDVLELGNTWSKVSFGRYTGYVRNKYIRFMNVN